MKCLALILLVILLIIVLWYCNRGRRCRREMRRRPCRRMYRQENYNSEPDRQFYKRIDDTNQALIDSGNTGQVVTDWQNYLTYTFLEPEVLQSHENYFSEAVGRLSNPSKWITLDGHTDDSAYNYVGLAQPRRVPIDPSAMLQPDVDIDNYRDPTGAESAVGRLATHWGYNN